MRIGADPGATPVPNIEKLKALDAYYDWRRGNGLSRHRHPRRLAISPDRAPDQHERNRAGHRDGGNHREAQIAPLPDLNR